MSTAHEINVHAILGSDAALTPNAGDKIYSLIIQEIEKSSPVSVNFEGIEYMTTAFLNAAIGQLYSKFTSEELNTFLSIRNISHNDVKLLSLFTERAKQYFKDKEDFENDVNSSIDNL